MKKNLIIGFLLVLFLGGCYFYAPYGDPRARPRTPEPQPYNRGYRGLDSSYFFEYLGPYGIWTRYSSYGYVWIPRDVGYRWRPYHRGHWVWTDYGWHWVSSERWGWLVYHYGRWGWDLRIGWYWVPDVVWGPAWVSWRYNDLYIGWAPIPPGVDLRPGRGYGRWNNIRIAREHWNFVRAPYFLDRGLDRWILPYERNSTIINLTVSKTEIKYRGNRVVNEGLGIDEYRRVTKKRVDKYELKDARQADVSRIEGRSVIVYRPDVLKNKAAEPKEYVEKDQVQKKIERDALGPVSRPSSPDEENRLRESHQREYDLLKKSQEEEISIIRKRADSEKAITARPEKKKAIDSKLKTQITEVKKKHAEETDKLARRQKGEEETVKKSRIKKKIKKSAQASERR